MRTIYKLRHKPTGLFYVKSGYNHISDKGTIYTTGNNSLSTLSSIYLNTRDQKLIQKYYDVFKSVGELRTEQQGSETIYHWSMMSPVEDFEKVIVLTDRPVNVPETVKELKNMDSVLEFVDQQSSEQYKLIGKWIRELRDVKKSSLRS